MLGIAYIDVADDVNDATVSLLRQTLVLAAVAGFHVEDRNVQTLCADDTQTAVGITKHRHGVGLNFHHQFIGFGDDISHRLTQILADNVHIYLRIVQFQIVEEYAIEVVVIILVGMRHNGIKILAALFDDRCQTDNFRAGADDDQQLQLAVVFEYSHVHDLTLHRISPVCNNLPGFDFHTAWNTILRFDDGSQTHMHAFFQDTTVIDNRSTVDDADSHKLASGIDNGMR